MLTEGIPLIGGLSTLYMPSFFHAFGHLYTIELASIVALLILCIALSQVSLSLGMNNVVDENTRPVEYYLDFGC